jgi:dTDP-4-dehydrorhamnose 3,5-epimerase
VTGFYNAATEGGVCWNDETLAIEWPEKNPLVSGRDATLPAFRDLKPLA